MTGQYGTNESEQTVLANSLKGHLVLGGARSGKSSFAEHQAHLALSRLHCNYETPPKLHYVATAICFDDEMRERVQHHQQQRGDTWHEHEAPYQLAEYLARFGEQDVVLIDCLTLWLNNVIYQQGDQATNLTVEAEIEKLCQAVSSNGAEFIMVSNEVGLGVVPLGKVSRLFVDNAGRMNQALAKVTAKVTLVAAGLPLVLKGL